MGVCAFTKEEKKNRKNYVKMHFSLMGGTTHITDIMGSPTSPGEEICRVIQMVSDDELWMVVHKIKINKSKYFINSLAEKEKRGYLIIFIFSVICYVFE